MRLLVGWALIAQTPIDMPPSHPLTPGMHLDNTFLSETTGEVHDSVCRLAHRNSFHAIAIIYQDAC